jgi:ABC-2 type transport system permease protein
MPIIFLLVFGGIFGGDSTFSPKVVILDEAMTTTSANFIDGIRQSEIFDLEEDPGQTEREEQLSRGELDLVAIIEPGFGEPAQEGEAISGNIRAQYPNSQADNATIIVSVLEQLVAQTNQEIEPYTPPLSVTDDPQSIAEFSSFDYTFAGLVAFSLLSLGVFGMANSFASDKKSGAIDRLRSAPIKARHLIIATGLNYVSLAMVSVAMMMAVAILVFDFNMQGDILSFIVMIVLGTICMFGLGFAVAGWTKDEKQAAPISNIVAFPMMFLSGVFFPTFIMPEWLQTVSAWLPLTPIAESIRLILMEGKVISELGTEILIITAWSTFFYTIAFKLFRWR